ncbi:MAG: DUF3367 domain-containing protein [Thermoplasmata archaeon]|nr:DUF3367 domain-containing protein [Thermoplasmata archaeon]
MVAVATWTTLVNFQGNYTVHFIDNSWPLNPSASLRALVYAWDPQQLGYLNLLGTLALPLTAWAAFLQLLGLPSGVQEIVTLVLLQVIAGFFLFLLFDRYILARAANGIRTPLAVFAALACLTNFGVQTVYWWDFLPYGFELLALGSVFLYLVTRQFEDSLERRPLRPLRVGAMAAAGAIAFSVNIPFNLSFLALTFLLPPIALAARGTEIRPFRSVVRFESALVGLVGLVSLWWLIPAAELVQLQPAYAVQQSASINGLAVFVNGTTPITFLSVLQGAVGYPLYSTGHYAATNWVSGTLAPWLEVLPVLTLFAGLVLRRSVLHRPLLLAVSGVVTLSLFVTGVNSPLYPSVFNTLFQSPILLSALRTPFVAFGEALEVLWIVAISLGVVIVSSETQAWLARPPGQGPAGWRWHSPALRNSKARWVALVAVIALVVLSPTLAAAPGAFAGDAVPRAPYQSRMAIAPYESAVADYVRSLPGDQYALLYPGGFLEQNWSHGYDSYDVLPSLLPGQFLLDNYREGFVVANNTLLTDAYIALQSGSPDTANYSQLLASLDVGALVVEGEVGGSYPFGQSVVQDYPRLLDALNRTANLTLSAIIGPDFIYTIAQPRPILSLASRSVAEASLLSGSIAPEVDLTQAYFNASEITTPNVPYQWLYPRWNGGIVYNASPVSKERVPAAALRSVGDLPSAATLFNGVPFDVPISAGDYLIVNFTTNAQTAISITLVTTVHLGNSSGALLDENSFSVGYPDDNLGLGDADLVSTYGANHFSSGGQSAVLIDDLSGSLGDSPNRTLRYVLVSLWPVLADGSGVRGLPVNQWPGNQVVTISQLRLGRDVYLSPPPLPVSPFTVLPALSESPANLTGIWGAGIGAGTPDAPADPLPVQTAAEGIQMELNASLRARWASASGSAVAEAFGGPTWYNANFLSIFPETDPYLVLNLTSFTGTGFSAGIVAAANITPMTGALLGNATVFLGGPPSPSGDGDPLLTPTYGGMHFTTNNSSATLVDNLLGSLPQASAPPAIDHLFLTLFFILPNGSGERGLSLSAWTGIQQLTMHSLFAAPYLWRGAVPIAEAPSLEALPLPTRGVGPSLATGTVVVSGPASSYARGLNLTFTESNPTDFQLMVFNSSGAPIGGEVLIVFDQTYHANWVLAASSGVASWSHVSVDTSLNGFLVRPESESSRMTFAVEFSGQTTYAVALALGIAVPPALALAAWAIPRWRSGVLFARRRSV